MDHRPLMIVHERAGELRDGELRDGELRHAEYSPDFFGEQRDDEQDVDNERIQADIMRESDDEDGRSLRRSTSIY